MSKNSLYRIANSSYYYKFYANKLVEFLPEDEKSIFRFVFHPQEWYNKFLNKNNPNNQDSQYLLGAVNELVNNLGKTNGDIMSLLTFYNTLEGQEKETYFKELMDAYDQVVQNKPQYNQNAYG
jgi:hypothetical protein